MSTDNNNDFSRNSYLEAIEAEHGPGAVTGNQRTTQRLENDGIKNVTPMHPADIVSIYPQAGGIFGKLQADLALIPNRTLEFNKSALDDTPSSPTTGGPGFKPPKA